MERPTYTVLDRDEGNVELVLRPNDWGKVAVEILQNGELEYTEAKDRGFWHNTTVRGNIAGNVAKTLTGVDQDAVRQGVKSALNQASLESDTEAFTEGLLPDDCHVLRDRTERVVIYPTESGGTEYKVTFADDPESKISGPRTISFDTDVLHANKPHQFEKCYLDAFQRLMSIESVTWHALRAYWLDVAEVKPREGDHETKAAIEEFVDKVHNASVWDHDSGEAFTWDSWNGYYVPDFTTDGGDPHEVVYVPGLKVSEWKHKDYDNVPLTRELLEAGVLAAPPCERSVVTGGKRRTVWPVVADEHPSVVEGAMHSHQEDPDEANDADGSNGTPISDDRPMGLR